MFVFVVGWSSARYSTQDMICSSPPEAAVVPPATDADVSATEHQTELTSTTIIIPKTLAALADNIEDDEDYADDEGESDNLEWSPRSAQSIPSLLDDDENAARIALRDRSNSELTLEPCLDSTIIETSQGLFLPQLIPEEEDSNGVEAASPLRRHTTPPSTYVKKKMGADPADTTIAVTVTPPSTPESKSSSRGSSSTIGEEDEENAAKHGRRGSNTSTAKTPKRSNRGSSGTGSTSSTTNGSTSDEIEVTFNEIQRKKNLRIKNFFRRLAKSVRKS